MIELMTKQFAKWASKQEIPENEIAIALKEVQAGNFEANLGGIFTKREFDFPDKVKVVADEL